MRRIGTWCLIAVVGLLALGVSQRGYLWPGRIEPGWGIRAVLEVPLTWQ